MEPLTYVIGHKNPDADAVCSAIGYAHLKNRQGENHVKAARCGNSNARIDAILQRFGVGLPTFVGDVHPRVRDIMRTKVFQVRPEQTCSDALELIDEHDVRALPVVAEDGRLEGTVSIFQLGEYFIPKAKDLRRLRHVRTSIGDIVSALSAKALNEVDRDRIEDLYVRIGAMDIRSFGKFSRDEQVEPSQNIIVVGDRWDIQQKSIQLGVRLLVITGELEVDEQVLQMAKERDVSLIVSPYDSATTSWIIRTAMRIRTLVEKKDLVTFSPDEPISHVNRKVSDRIAPIYLVVDDEEKLIGVFSKTDLLRPSRTRLILVDHNELSQAVNGAGQVPIEEVVDHHRLGNPPTQQPILFINRPVGSTCTIVADQFRHFGIDPEPKIAGILLCGILSDTLNLQSPTSTETDEKMVTWLEGICGEKRGELAELIFSSGSVILTKKPAEVIEADMKEYEEQGVKFSVSQVEELGFDNFWKHAEALHEALGELREKKDYLFSALLVTDINKQNSLLLMRGSDELVEQIDFVRAHNQHDIFDLPSIVSRKKQLIPYFTSLLSAGGFLNSAA